MTAASGVELETFTLDWKDDIILGSIRLAIPTKFDRADRAKRTWQRHGDDSGVRDLFNVPCAGPTKCCCKGHAFLHSVLLGDS